MSMEERLECGHAFMLARVRTPSSPIRERERERERERKRDIYNEREIMRERYILRER